MILVLAAALSCAAPAAARAHAVSYRGYRIVVPAGWPVFNLAADPSVCVRFNRHAVYLGRPSAQQRCPAHTVGRTEAILIEPTAPGAHPGRVVVTATWDRHPGLVRSALGPALSARSFRSITAAAAAAAGPSRPAQIRARAAAASAPGGVYTGPGFDVCSAPSTSAMSAWHRSRYRGVGVYIGGANMACSQSNLTTSWVAQESAAGWHLIPTYVGLQAPSNSCGCAGINPSSAAAQGAAAANDAVKQAQSVGINAGNPIYFDMEAYPPGGANTTAVLKFLSSWTKSLHAAGYKSGVYSSADSGISDLVNAFGSSFTEPDDVWVADWNGAQNTRFAYVPTGDWGSHQRLHQFEGGHDETYGGVTMNIDGNYLDGSTAASGAPVTPPVSHPSLQVAPGGDGAVYLQAAWPGAANVAAWRMLGGVSPTSLTPLFNGPTPGLQVALVVHSAFPYFAAQALGPTGQVLATTTPMATPPRIAVFGRSGFVPSGGLGGIPAGCFTGSPCHIVTTISSGRTIVAQTGAEFIAAGVGGVLHFGLTAAGQTMLRVARSHRLPVTVVARDGSGTSATTTLNLIPYSTSGRAPSSSLTQSPTLRIVGVTDFVSRGGVGGILSGCFQPTPCRVNSQITARHKVIATAFNEFVGANELGYLMFTLTPQGKAMLAHARGNQLAAHVIAIGGGAGAGASANLRLIGYS